jgi:hypothetical protein
MLRKVFIFIVALIPLAIAACQPLTTEEAPFYTQVSEATLNAGDEIPAPTGDVILTVTGNIGTSNTDDGSIQMDRETIQRLGEIEYSVTDPFENVERVYRGPRMSDLLALWQVPDDATQIEVTALDDYVVNVSIADLKNYPVLFALQQDGEDMPVATRGPAMLVFPYDNFEFNQQVYNDFWAWQIASMDVQ